MIGPQPIHHVQVGKTILVKISKPRVATPTSIPQVQHRGNVLEYVSAQIFVENAVFRPVRVEMPGKGVLAGHIIATPPELFGRITSNVDQEKIQQPIIIEIKEYGGGGMSHII